MSYPQIQFHDVVSVDVHDFHVDSTNWVELAFKDAKGSSLRVIVYAEDTKAILAALAKCDDAALTAAYAEGRKDEREAIEGAQT